MSLRQRRSSPNGEVRWPLRQAESAVNALADGGLVVLGLDLRESDEHGQFFEIPWTSYEPAGLDDVQKARAQALMALRRAEPPAKYVLITWKR